MYISELRIRNFKNLISNKFKFDSHITTIIGENGTGKTNIFHALRHLLDSSCRMFLSEESFSSSLRNPKGHWIIISAKFEEVGDSIEEISLKPNENNLGIFTLIFRPKKQVRIELHRMSEEMKSCQLSDKQHKIQEIRKYINNIDILNDYEVKRSVSTIFNFLDDSIYNNVVGDFESLCFPDVENQDDKAIVGNSDLNFQDYVNVTFIPAIRDVTTELTNNNNFLARMLKNISEKVNNEEWEKFEENIAHINDGLSQIDQFTHFIDEVDELTRKTVGSIYSTNVKLSMEIPNSRSNLMKYFTLKGEEDGSIYGLYNRSLGDNNIIYFALKLTESKMRFGNTRKVYNLLLIEEPEAHIHKFLQESLFSGIRKQKDEYQLIISTHSVHISESSKLSSMIVLDKEVNRIKSYSPTNNLTIDEITLIERYFDVTKTPLLFSKSVWIVEGAAELLLIPTLIKRKYDVELSSYGISLMSIDGSYFDSIGMLFHKDRIQKYVVFLTDGDKDFVSPNSEKENNARNRVNRLKINQQNNEFVFVSTSEFTFEIDFFRENIETFKRFVIDKEIYTNSSLVSELDSVDTRVVYSRILKICDYVGKGKMAYLFSKWLETENDTATIINIPKYIDDAFDFLRRKIRGNKYPDKI